MTSRRIEVMRRDLLNAVVKCIRRTSLRILLLFLVEGRHQHNEADSSHSKVNLLFRELLSTLRALSIALLSFRISFRRW